VLRTISSGGSPRKDSFIGRFVPHLLETSGHNWNTVIWVAAGTYLISALCWVFIDPVTPID